MTAQSKVEAATLSVDLVAAFNEIESAAKDKINPAFKSKYADIASVIDAIKPVLAKHNLAFYQRPQPSEDGVLVQTLLRHVSGEEVDLGTLYVPANKKDAQGFGSALTYARRYALMTAFGVPAEDDDGNAAVRSAPRAAASNGNGAKPPITDQQRDMIQTLASAAGKSLQTICEAYRVDSLKALTASQADAVIARLQPKKEPVNA